MKRAATLLLGVLLALCMVFTAACAPNSGNGGNSDNNGGGNTPDVTQPGLRISQATATLDLFETRTLQLSATTEVEADYVFDWASADKSVATVSSAGLVTAVAAGETDITVSCRVRGTKNVLENKTCIVTVTSPENFYEIEVGGSSVASNEITKSNPGKWYLFYSSSFTASEIYCMNDDVIMNVEGIKSTQWYLRYYPKFEEQTVIDVSFTVSVNVSAYLRASWGSGKEYIKLDAGENKVALQFRLNGTCFSLSLTTSESDVYYGGDFNLKLTDVAFEEGVNLTDEAGKPVSNATIDLATDKTTLQLIATPPAGGAPIEWASDNTAVATVDENGLVTGVTAGRAVVTAKSGTKQASCEITVLAATARLEGISATSATLDLVGQTAANTVKLEAIIEGEGQCTLTWSSSDEKVATVDEGVVTAVSVGTAIITVTDGVTEKTCKVQVIDSSDVQSEYDVSNGTASDALGNPGRWYLNQVNGVQAHFAEDTLQVTTDAKERTFTVFYQPMFAVGTKYTVSITMARVDAGKSWGSLAARLHYGTGTGYNSNNSSNDKIVTEHEDDLKGYTGSKTFTGEFTVEADTPFFFTFKCAVTPYLVTITFTPVQD